MIKPYPIGIPLTFIWRFLTPDNQPLYFDPEKHTLRLRYYSGRGTKDIDTFIVNSDRNGISWTLLTDKEFFAGRYSLVLDVSCEDRIVCHIHYTDAFALCRSGEEIINTRQENRYDTIELLSVAEFYYFTPHDGKSAYDIWLEQGNEGSEQDFLDSLRGEDGAPGPAGPAGADGAKGDKGDKGDTGPAGINSGTFAVNVSNTTGNPSGSATVDNGNLTISLSGIKGEQGNTGSSVDYPYELVNNLTTDDATKGLSAAQGKRVADKIEDMNLSILGTSEIDKEYVWADGFVASGTVISSPLSKFCQPVLFHAGEKLTYKTGSDYQSAVVQVTDDTPIAVGSTGITVQVLINAGTANTQYEYTFETDMWVVISVLKSDYVLNTYIYRANSISEQIDHIEEKVYPQFTSLPAVNACIDELYISGYKDGYYISYFYWTGSALTMIIRDSSDNIIWFANGMSVTVGEVFQLSQNGVTVYGILNSTTHLVSPIVASIGWKSLSLDENPQASAKALAPNVYYSPLCVSRFNLGTLPDADHNASWLGIVRRCDEVNDSVFCFANKMAPAVSNHFFDFYEVGTHARGVPYVAEMETYLDYSGKNGLSTSDALLMPLVVAAVNNADGDNTVPWFTGGNHAYGNTATGSPTLREVSNTVRVDGVLVPVGRGGVRGRVCTVDLVDRIQGYNTCKENGGGREIIQENVHIEVTNDYIETTVEFVALESVIVYGPMYASGMNVENMVGYRFIGSQTKRGLYVYNGGNVPGNDDNAINAISIHTADNYVFDTVLDLSYGQGNKLMSGAPNCIVTTSKKAYFVVIPAGTQVSLDEGGSICYRTRMYFRKK